MGNGQWGSIVHRLFSEYPCFAAECLKGFPGVLYRYGAVDGALQCSLRQVEERIPLIQRPSFQEFDCARNRDDFAKRELSVLDPNDRRNFHKVQRVGDASGCVDASQQLSPCGDTYGRRPSLSKRLCAEIVAPLWIHCRNRRGDCRRTKNAGGPSEADKRQPTIATGQPCLRGRRTCSQCRLIDRATTFMRPSFEEHQRIVNGGNFPLDIVDVADVNRHIEGKNDQRRKPPQ